MPIKTAGKVTRVRLAPETALQSLSLNHVPCSLPVSLSRHQRAYYPTRTDYINHLISRGIAGSEAEILKQPHLVAAIQRNWHARGQTGCQFAQLLAQQPREYGWDFLVVTTDSRSFLSRALSDLQNSIESLIALPRTQAVSVVFPKCLETEDLVVILRALSKLSGCLLSVASHPDSHLFLVVGLRVPISKGKVMAEALGFGPFSFLPLTRQAPFMEVIFAVREKSFPQISKRLDDNPLVTHLADVKIPRLALSSFERMWKNTERSKRKILGGRKQNHGAKAGVTFCVPREAWEQ